MSEQVNLFSQEVNFEVEVKYISHIVGKAGAGVNKLKEELGVRIDIADEDTPPTNGSEKPRKKKRVNCTIKGRKENVEEAKKRITSLVDRLADEVTLTIHLDEQVERGSLIGKGGTFLKRLENNYEVRINFPGGKKDELFEGAKENKNEIIIRGPKKGAEAAKKEVCYFSHIIKRHVLY
jgi:predicted PilT family ATPase